MKTAVFDTGALIALERRRQGMIDVLEALRELNATIVIPAVAVAEWWRGKPGQPRLQLSGYVAVSSMSMNGSLKWLEKP